MSLKPIEWEPDGMMVWKMSFAATIIDARRICTDRFCECLAPNQAKYKAICWNRKTEMCGLWFNETEFICQAIFRCCRISMVALEAGDVSFSIGDCTVPLSDTRSLCHWQQLNENLMVWKKSFAAIAAIIDSWCICTKRFCVPCSKPNDLLESKEWNVWSLALVLIWNCFTEVRGCRRFDGCKRFNESNVTVTCALWLCWWSDDMISVDKYKWSWWQWHVMKWPETWRRHFRWKRAVLVPQ